MSNDSLGDLSMKPTRDELAQRQHVRGKPSKPSSNTPPPRSRPPASGGSSSQGGLWVVLLLVIAAAAGGGWYLWNQIEMMRINLAQSTQALSSSEQALSTLQSSLDNRDNTLSKSGDQMLEDIKGINSEIRKLWDLSNKRNKVDIAKLDKLLKELDSNLKSTGKLLNDVKAQAASVADQVSASKKTLNELQENNGTITKTLDTQQKELAAQKKELAALNSQLGSSTDFEDRITSIEIAIKAIDAHRSQVNGQLLRIDSEIGALQQKVSATPGG